MEINKFTENIKTLKTKEQEKIQELAETKFLVAKITEIKDLAQSYRKKYICVSFLVVVFVVVGFAIVGIAAYQKRLFSFVNVFLLILNVITIIFIIVTCVNLFKIYTNLNSTIGSLILSTS